MSTRPEKSLLAERERLEAKLRIAHFRVLDVEASIDRINAAIDALKVKAK